MYEEDLRYLRAPGGGDPLKIGSIAATGEDGELLTGDLVCERTGETFPVRNGIPRFVEPGEYNATWDYKWRRIDRGRGLNYLILDKNDPAYQIHDLFDRNDHGGGGYLHAGGRLAVDLGCGVGQYSIKLMQEVAPEKIVAVDLTSAVDTFRDILLKRFPEYRKRILIVQANILNLPLQKGGVDFVMSLGVLMHTGDTPGAVRAMSSLLKEGGQANFWIYASEPIAYNACEPGREGTVTIHEFPRLYRRYRYAWRWIRLFRNIRHSRADRIVRFMSSNFVHKLRKKRGFLWINTMFPAVDHPDPDYRYLNNYDGYVNQFDDSWNEHEIFPLLRQSDLVIKGMSPWRLGFWVVRDSNFYDTR